MSIEHGVTAGAPKPVAKAPQAGAHGQGAGKTPAATPGDFASLLMNLGAEELAPQEPASDAAAGATVLAVDPAVLPADAGLAVPVLPSAVPAVAAEAPPQAPDPGLKLLSSVGEATAALPSPAAGRAELRTPQTGEQPAAVDAPSLPSLAADAANATAVPADGVQPLLRQAALAQRMAQHRSQTAELAAQAGKEKRGEDVVARLGWRLSEQPAPVGSPMLAAGLGESGLRSFERRGEKSGPRVGGVGEAGSWSGVAQPDNSRVAVLAVAPDGGLTTEMRVAEQVSYWIGRGAQNAELEVEGLGEGPVKVSIELQGQEARVEFRADQAQTRQMLQDSMPHLRELLEREGLVLSGMSIGSSGAGGGQGQSSEDRPGHRQGRAVLSELPAVARAASHRAAPLSGRSVDLFV
ncbi:hypothetical protein GCM10027399_02460 [Curvibacter fontanus]|jgi:flagellar hook-length control protein FliK